MDAMPTAPAHAKPARRDLLWVLVLILACGLLEVWASWLSIGAVSGFPKLGRMTTGWILPVTTEAYWSAALFAWLAVPAGPKSAAFAKWSAAAMFALSLAGQESDHLLAAAGRTAPPVFVVGFVTALPLISVALIAILIHLRQTDRDDAAAAGRRETEAARAAAAEAVASDERTALRAQLETARADAAAAVSDRESLRDELTGALETAHADLAEALARAEKLAQKLAAVMESKRRQVKDPKGRKNAQAEGISLQLKAANLMDEKPHLRAPRMGGELARELGVSSATGTRLHKLLTAEDSPGESLSEESGNPSGDRSENQS